MKMTSLTTADEKDKIFQKQIDSTNSREKVVKKSCYVQLIESLQSSCFIWSLIKIIYNMRLW
jgi:hypothetical protein